ncbi:hypothetical protein COY90_02340 [Candidatus Roizmanbacteria bacterium CG_4_10_14_0_8_um_filter_39_9]|uniref:Nudix hydrolase domain-containing protein n=1 Tax=Candidatus Roizmanbacteria bacterium CG_4_10_14_0_8_um_filter_39_9 TaxID=1974829 RepID=A0A2M7QDW1_9BACT|nr:MAG: hypothetical protein COY90_02340 [Candidatus Roizmanbacteria bacterium CG_4_10_14_0_8_um_filter_39_9]
MDYYKEVQYIAQVDKDDTIIGKIEKWEAHKKGILHRGYTAILMHKENVIVQHRKHPLFDDVFDLTFSSHHIYQGDALQTNEQALYEGLLREWGMESSHIMTPPKLIDKAYYKAHDEKSTYTEHEIDYIFLVKLDKVPLANPDFAYGYELIPKEVLHKKIQELHAKPAPWVREILGLNW